MRRYAIPVCILNFNIIVSTVQTGFDVLCVQLINHRRRRRRRLLAVGSANGQRASEDETIMFFVISINRSAMFPVLSPDGNRLCARNNLWQSRATDSREFRF